MLLPRLVQIRNNGRDISGYCFRGHVFRFFLFIRHIRSFRKHRRYRCFCRGIQKEKSKERKDEAGLERRKKNIDPFLIFEIHRPGQIQLPVDLQTDASGHGLHLASGHDDQNRSRIVSIPKVLVINSLFAALTSLMVIFTSFTDSPFLGMLISLIFGKTDLFSDHPVMAFFVMGAIFWVCVLILALCFTWTSRLVNRKLSFLRALDTVSISSIYICFSDILIFLSVLFGSRGAFTLIFVAMVIMGICHFVSVKQDLALSDNSAFNMLVISYLLFYFLAQLGVNVLIRIFVLF